MKKTRRKAKRAFKVLFIVALGIAGIWLALEPIALHYLRKTLNEIEGYEGGVADVNIQLFRAEAKVDSMWLEKVEGNFTEPFVSLPSVAFTVHWKSLLKGRLVGEITLQNPELNIELEPNTQELNVDTDVNWVQVVKELGVIQINKLTIKNGTLNYLDRSGKETIDFFLNQLEVEAYNLATVEDRSKDFPSSLEASAVSMGKGMLDADIRGNFLRELPDMDLSVKYTDVDLSAFNETFNKYARIDIERGELDVFTEVVLKDSVLEGYVKPLLQNVEIIDWDEREEKPLRAVWEGLVGLLTTPITNLPEDQVATKIPVKGRISNVKTGHWTAIGELLTNAYIDPLEEQFESVVKGD